MRGLFSDIVELNGSTAVRHEALYDDSLLESLRPTALGHPHDPLTRLC